MSNFFGGQEGASAASMQRNNENSGLRVEIQSSRGDVSQHMVRRGLNRAEGPPHNEKSFLYGLQQQGQTNQSLGASLFVSGNEFAQDLSVPIELTAADMSLSTLYLHELHHRQVRVSFFTQFNLKSTV